METGIICVTVRRMTERKRVFRGAAVANHSAGGTVEAAAVPRRGGAVFTDGGGKERVRKQKGDAKRRE